MTIREGLGPALPRRLAGAAWDAAARLRRDRGGSAAVEFGLVVIPFIALLFAILQTALVIFTGQVLDTALQDTARLIMTGQAKTMDAATFATGANGLCSRITALFNCTAAYNSGALQIDVLASTDFPSAVPPIPTVSGDAISWGTAAGWGAPSGHASGKPLYSNPGTNQVVIVRAAYLEPIYMSFPVKFMGTNMDPGLKTSGSSTSRLILSTVAFRNEPF